MSTSCRTFWLPRRGSLADHYEDAFAADVAAGRYSVSDGATQSSFAGLWARLLVEDFVQNADCGPDHWRTRVAILQKRWDTDVSNRVLPWHAQTGMERGAFATFLGLVLTGASVGCYTWEAVAVGDTCMFHTRMARLLEAFPLDESGRFTDFPVLLGSRAPVEEVWEKLALWTRGSARRNDRLWIMTDALAQWCLEEHEAGRNPWHQMERLLSPSKAEERFAAWVENLRDTTRLRNDDVTLLAISL